MDGLLGVAGIIIDSDSGSFPHSLLSTSKFFGLVSYLQIFPNTTCDKLQFMDEFRICLCQS